jgi:peptidoglycan/LPS O-acetylase OafA/YrhL
MRLGMPPNNYNIIKGRNNNFDFLRFLFAFIVFLVHSSRLSRDGSFTFITNIITAKIAVESFFIISGFLIFMSYDNSKSINNYFSKRVRRLYPGYFCVIILCAIVGFFITNKSWQDYLSTGLLKYLFANLVFLNFLCPSLPGVFQNNPVTGVNGALWTLKIEIMFYLIVPILSSLFNKFNKIILFGIIYVLSVSYVIVFNMLYASSGKYIFVELGKQLPGQLSFFMSGALIYYYFNYFSKRPTMWFLIALPIYACSKLIGIGPLVPLSLAVIIIYFSYFFYYLGNFGKYGDLSYGIYIYHFPIIQILINYNNFNLPSYLVLPLYTIILLVMAFISWHVIEKSFLQRSSHYILASLTKESKIIL